MSIEVCQFQGQWLWLAAANQTRMGGPEGSNALGVNTVAGERVWDVQGKIRLRIGPLRLPEFLQFLPDRTSAATRALSWPVGARKRSTCPPSSWPSNALIIGWTDSSLRHV